MKSDAPTPDTPTQRPQAVEGPGSNENKPTAAPETMAPPPTRDAGPPPRPTAMLGDELAVTVPSRTPGLQSEEARQLGRYVLLEQIGAGGMGEVYTAFDRTLDRKVAIKLLYPTADGSARDEMLKEARALAQLSHAAVVTVHDVGVVRERAYIAMEYASGEALLHWQRGKNWRDVLQVYVEAGEGLDAAHRAGFIHRDFKPSNVIRRDDGRVQLLDFGIAQKVKSTEEVGAARVAGTPGYMSPEQMAADPLDARSDQFSFCVALWEALHGCLPFGDKAETETLAKVRDGRVDQQHSKGVPKRLDKVLLKGMAYEPKDRFGSMGELLRSLKRARPPGISNWAVLIAVSLLAGVAVAVAWLKPRTVCNSGEQALHEQWTGLAKSLPQSLRGSPHAVNDVIQGMQDWITALDTTATEICQDFNAGKKGAGQLALERQCLEDRQSELWQALATLKDERSVARAREALMQYLPPDTCLHTTDLSQFTQHEAEKESWAALITAQRAIADGAWTDSLPLAQRAVELSKTHSPTIHSASLRLLGLSYERLGDPQLAADRLHEAAQVAVAAGDTQRAAEAWIPLSRVLAARLLPPSSSNPKAGWTPVRPGENPAVWLDYASSEVVRHPTWPELNASFQLTHALIAWRKGDAKQARDDLALAQKAISSSHPLRAAVLMADAVVNEHPSEVDQAFKALEAVHDVDDTPSSVWVAMGDWVVLLPPELAAPQGARLLEHVVKALPESEGSGARLYFATLAWQAGSITAAQRELTALVDDEKNPPLARAIAKLRLQQLRDPKSKPEPPEASPAVLAELPSLLAAWNAELKAAEPPQRPNRRR